jgi:hypothetical protein
MAKHILNLTVHFHDVSRAPAIFLIKALSNALSAFMMRTADNRFACHIMNSIGDHLDTFMMWIVM